MAAYCAGALIANQLLVSTDLGSVFFVPAGVTAAALMLERLSRWPVILAAVLVVETAISLQVGAGLATSAGAIAANMLEPLIGAAIAIAWRGRPDLARPQDLVAFLLGPVAIGPMVGAGIAAGMAWLDGEPFVWTLVTWWLGHGVAVLVVGALIMTSVANPVDERFRATHTWFAFVIVVMSALILFEMVDLPLGFLAILPVATLSARYGARAATTASFAVAAVAFGARIVSNPTPAGLSASDGMITVQLQIVAIAAAALLVAAETSQRELTSLEASSNLETVRMLRAALSPEQVVNGCHVHAEGLSTSASERLEVGGDWYDVAETPDGLVRILIGDVTGHGADALVSMGQLKFAASAFTSLTNNPAQVLDWLDAYAGRPATRVYATAFCAVYDPMEQRLNYATAGHPPALLGRSDGSWAWLTGARSPLLGLGRRGARRAESITIDGPCTLIAYTDGVVERPGEAIDVGLERMHDIVSRDPDQSIGALVERLHADSRRDDASVLRIRLRP